MLRRRAIFVGATSLLSALGLGVGMLLVSVESKVTATATTTSTTTPISKRSAKRPIQIINDGKAPFKVFWVNPDSKEEVLMSSDAGVMPGTEFPLDSWVGHQFMAREVPAADGKCNKAGDGRCRAATFQVSPNDEQVIHVTEDFRADFVDSRIKAQRTAADLLEECRATAKRRAASAEEELNNRTAAATTTTTTGDKSDGDAAAQALLDELVRCVEGGVAGTLERLNEEIAFQASVRTGIAERLENYTCLDPDLNTTDDLHTTAWTYRGVRRVVHVKHERPASRIHVVEGFIDDEECAAMEKAAAKSLHRATVADGKGGSRLSEHRKAMQAGIVVPWDREAAGDPIARLSRRVYDYANHVLGLDIREHGQEDLMSIQYEGRGRDDKEPDRYTPHCDGDCTGLPHKFGQRMATMVLYCDVPEEGGHTNFRNAGVHVKPERGNGIFFSYIDPQTKVMDTGFTEHSGCPVFVGSKKIVTQWIRLGVDHDNPWDSFNTLGVKKSDLAEYGTAEDSSAEHPDQDEPEDDNEDGDEDGDFDDEDFEDEEGEEDSAAGGEGDEL